MQIIRAKARTADPETSHEAAASIDDITERQQAVLKVLKHLGACTDEWLNFCYPNYARQMGLKPQSESGVRSRRADLVKMGLVEWTGERKPTKSGRGAQVWRAV